MAEGMHSNTGLPQETQKKNPQINNRTLQLKELEKEQQTKPKENRRKEIIKIRVKISEIESRKTIQRLMKPRAGYLKE